MYAEVTRLGTSGTTGTPKGVPLCNVNEVLSAHDAIMHFPLTPRDVTLNMTPWFHRGGLHSGGPCPTLYAGAALVILRMFSAKAAMDCVEKYGVTFLIGVPAALKTLADRQERHPTDLSGLHGIVTMGSPLEKADCIRYQRVLTRRIFNGYGTTETFWNSFLRPWDLPEMAGSAGGRCTDDEVRVVRMYPDGRRADPDDTVPRTERRRGEIIIFAPEKSALCSPATRRRPRRAGMTGGSTPRRRHLGREALSHHRRPARRHDHLHGGEHLPRAAREVLCRHPKIRDCMVTGVADPARGRAPSPTSSHGHTLAPESSAPGAPPATTFPPTSAALLRLRRRAALQRHRKKQHVLLKRAPPRGPAGGVLQRREQKSLPAADGEAFFLVVLRRIRGRPVRDF
jgi:acyl-CoA synthetase (AMP-forming)/AMP-acid ligase II